MFDQQAARAAFHSIGQRGAETLHEYKARFQDAVRAMELHGLSAPEQAEQATHFLSTLDPGFFVEFLVEIYNDNAMRGIEPPVTLVDAFSKASRYLTLRRMPTAAGAGGATPFTNAIFAVDAVRGSRGRGRGRGRGSGGRGGGQQQGATEAQPAEDEESGGQGGAARSPHRCNTCREEGHFAADCPLRHEIDALVAQRRARAGAGKVQDSAPEARNLAVMTATHTADHQFMLAQSPSFPPRDNSSVRYDVILDSAAAECTIRDKELLANIRSAETAIEVVGIAPGHPSIKLDTVGDIFGLGTVFYSPLVAANVLSLADMEARHEMTYRKGSFEVKLASGNVVAFSRGASQHPGVGYSKHYVARFPRRFAVAPAIQGAFGKGANHQPTSLHRDSSEQQLCADAERPWRSQRRKRSRE